MSYRQNCKSGFIELIKSDFPESFDEADDDITENVTANAEDERVGLDLQLSYTYFASIS